MRYMVTGADGFIASHLCDELLARGHEVIAFCHYNSRQKLANLRECDRLRVVWGDVTCPDTLMQVPRDGIDGVFHLAAAIDVAWSLQLCSRLEEGGYYFNNNTVGSRNAWQFASRCGARCVLMSSSEIYGTPALVPIREDWPYNPQSPYAESKVLAEIDARRAIRDGNEIVIARPFNTYGPRQTARGVIAKICAHAAECGTIPIKLGNVETKRDWVYVSDTANGLIACMERGRRGEIYNLGTGRAVTVREAANMAGITQIRERCGQDRGQHEVLILQADAGKAKATLGWEPVVTLEEGLKRTIESYVHE